VQLGRERDDLCLDPEEGATVVDASGATDDLSPPGLYRLDLRATAGMEVRAAKAAAVMNHVFEHSKETGGGYPSLVVVDEAQNYAPEQQTGWLARVRPAYDALFSIAAEGRKFGVGLAVSTQRPARLSKDILSQCNTHLIFRVANVEDLAAIAGSFEAAMRSLLEELPGFDTGTCVAGGTAIGMVVRVQVPHVGPPATVPL
jgi:DNA helicase HerA-like ATPase